MDIWFIYLVKTLLLPGASLLLLSCYGCFYVIKNKGKGRWILIVPLLSLLLLSIPIVASSLAKWQQPYAALDLAVIDKIKPQAIVVLGGGVETFAPEYNSLTTINSRTLLRLRYAAYLARKSKLPILVSGGKVFESRDESEASLMASVLSKEFNTPVQWLEPLSRNTAENASYSQRVLAKNKINRIILVTAAMHMGRAVAQFKGVGMIVVPAATGFVSISKLDLFHFLPSARALEMSSMAIHEWLGQQWYSLRY